MVQSVIQHSFHAGEWAPALYARVDLAKYHSAAALLRNFFVDYRGGASSRTGTKYIAPCKYPDQATRLIPFQPAFTVGYILEFGDQYIRFYFGGAQVMDGAVPYEISSPYLAADLHDIKFAQNVDQLIICHPNYPPSVLTLISATSWTLATIVFGSTVSTPTGVSVSTTLAAGSVNYAYTVTAVDANGQESGPATPAILSLRTDIRSVAGTNTISWTAVPGASSYNVYTTVPSYAGAPPAGAAYGFIGNCTGVSFTDSNIAPDFSQGPPVVQTPSSGAGIQAITITNAGAYTSGPVPTTTFDAAPAGGTTASGFPVLKLISATVAFTTNGFPVGYSQSVSVGGTTITIEVTAAGGGFVNTVDITNPGSLSSGTVPSSAYFTYDGGIHYFILNLTWGVDSISLITAGAGYTVAPGVTFSSGSAAATTTLAPTSTGVDAAPFSGGNPSVVSFFQQRMVLAAPRTAVQSFYMSQPGSYFNFNISNPIQADDAITGTIVDGHLNEIQSLVSVPTGMMALTSRAAWLINGGGGAAVVTPIDVQANAHSYTGASEVPPIVSNYDILFVQSKGSIIRDMSFNFYAQVFTGTDISVLSSHLFYGFTIKEWAWGEEPFKVVWAVRSDGTMLTLTFLKEQEIVGWSHQDTQGLFQSVATVTEETSVGDVDAIYTIIQRTINGSQVQYVERFTERQFNGLAANAWCVDAGIQYSGAPATSFSGAQHLAGATVTGLADGIPITPFVMDSSGNFTLPIAASAVVVGLAYTPQLQTLPLDTGEPTIQGKRKGINGVTVRCQETLGLSIGKSFDSLVPMKDLVRGNVGSASNEVVTDLVTGDTRTIIDPSWDVPGQYCIQQSYPLPATILGVIPEIEVGDTGPTK